MTEFKNNHLKVGDRVRYLDRIPHSDERHYEEWYDEGDVSGKTGVVVRIDAGDVIVLLDDENISYEQVVHPDNLERI